MAKVAENIRGMGRKVITLKVDVRDRPAVEEAVEETVSQLGGLDIMVANAGA